MTIIGVVLLTLIVPAVTLYNQSLRHPTLLILGSLMGFWLIGFSASSTTEWMRPFLLQVFYPILVGYLLGEAIVRYRQSKSTATSRDI